MIKAILVDDESASREILQGLLENFCPQVNIVGLAKDAFEAKELIRSKKPDVVFLDIEMPQKSGIQLIKEQSPIDYKVIFVTAYNDYVLPALRLSAVDYLLKPIDIEELKSAVSKIETGLNKQEQIDSLLYNLSNSKKRIALSQSNRIDFVNLDEILYLKADGNYTTFKLEGNREIVVSKTLKEYESVLPDQIFARCHKSFLINMEQVERFDRDLTLHMKNGDQILVSRYKKDELLNRLMNT
ncbi:MAG: response regulator transcription factor [Bacteroidetes bacterium]|nr:MAG: response regulator transcription factor [Bacteroidota bacterium]